MVYRVNGGCVSIEYLVLGPIENNVYLIDDGEMLFVVDPSCGVNRILEAVGDRTVHSIVLTHAHWDHVGGAKELRDATGARVIASAVDAPVISGERKLDPSHRPFTPCPVDVRVSDGDTVKIGDMAWNAMLTPGHTPGSMCLFLDGAGEGRQGAPVLISGDTLFAGTHGRTDFVGGDPAMMVKSLARLAQLPAQTIVLPGHNNLTVMAREQRWIQRR